jgi:O-antigen/teichoic acid export membrane protein
VLSVVAARYLGPDGMGRQSLIAFTGLSIVALATAGLPPSLARSVAELLGAGQGGQALALYRFTRRLEAVAATLAFATLAVVAALGSRPAAAWVLAGVATAFAVLQAVPSSLLSGAQRWRAVSMVGLANGAASVPATIVVLAAGGGITGLFAVEAAFSLLTLLGTTVLARRVVVRLPPPRRVATATRKAFLGVAAIATFMGAIQFVVWRRSELLVMNGASTDAQIAMYSIAFAVVSGLARIPEAIEAVTMPAVATLLGRGEQERVRSGFWRSQRLLVLLTPVLVVGAAVTGPPLIELAYGHGYRAAGPVLLVLLVPLAFQPLFTTSEAVLFAMGRLRVIVRAGLVACVVDAALAVALVPRLDAVGAAVANVAAQLTAGIPVLVALARLQAPVDVRLAPLARGLLTALVVGAAALAARAAIPWGGPAIVGAVVAGMAAFVVAGALLRPLAAEDAEWLARALGGRRGLARAAARLGR